ncbi:MAG TPA: RnfABCDGE type electron transport complex subunit D [Bacillota bacterium]|nr:RnfABCDGE type electron transport complex subunit D [Bacillota bacterium]HOL08542.1 RnfABCDGE type electron transport complex subunit D [Bacillota bacterium]HPO96977.1 RnfABCDGE type electron transport complex subunit D [Bacillota bacterium]
MMDTQVVVSPAPHITDVLTTEKAMRLVMIALLPATLFSIWNFGFKALVLIIVSMITAIGTEFVIQKLTKKTITVNDGSAALTGLLLALTVTPELPVLIIVVGAVVAIALGKHIFGGLGYNLFNPALIGRAFMLASWPAAMITWSWPKNGLAWAGANADAIAGATVLNLEKAGILQKMGLKVPYLNLLIGNISGSLGETSTLLLLLGGLFLIITKVIDWRIPVSYLSSVLILSLIFQKDPLLYLMAGGLMLGAFFMATDWVTSPITKKGRIYFGIGCGIITVIIRIFGGYPEGVCYSILIMNAVTPLLDRLTIPKRFGEVKARG